MTKLEKFNSFLEQHNCKDEFYRNMNRSLEGFSLEISDIIDHHIISCCFLWFDTPEGHTWWEAVNNAWKRYYNELS